MLPLKETIAASSKLIALCIKSGQPLQTYGSDLNPWIWKNTNLKNTNNDKYHIFCDPFDLLTSISSKTSILSYSNIYNYFKKFISLSWAINKIICWNNFLFAPNKNKNTHH